MKTIFQIGDKKEYQHLVTLDDIAQFKSGTVHEVYSTFSIARDAEWSGRLFVLEMLESHEEGIGVSINVQHHGPAFVGETVNFIALLDEVTPNGKVITSYKVQVGERLIATGIQEQRILPKEKITKIFEDVKNGVRK